VRKVVQISWDTAGDSDGIGSQMWIVCDDGTVWWRELYKPYAWHREESLPPGCIEESNE
jgi:hypothetical protein